MILLMGRWDHGGNLVIESSDEFPDSTPEKELDDLVDEQPNGDGMAWAASFEVDSHRAACQEAYETYVQHEGARLIDEVHGVLVDD